MRSRDRIVGILIRLWAGQPKIRGSIPGKGSRILFSPKRPDRLLRLTQRHLQWLPGAFSAAIKRPASESDQSPPFIPYSTICLSGMLRDNFPVTFPCVVLN
jgi:hypothetical protein